MILLNQLEPDDLPDMTLLRRALMADFKNRFPRLRRGTKDWQDALAEDPFVNALHVRYGYAVTCHKSQGGEWPHVFVTAHGRDRDPQPTTSAGSTPQ